MSATTGCMPSRISSLKIWPDGWGAAPAKSWMRHGCARYPWGRRASGGPMKILAVWIINALSLLALPYIFTGIKVEGFYTAMIVALVLGLINAVLRPLL